MGSASSAAGAPSVVTGALLTVPHGEAARQALWALIAGVQAGDPLAPVTVAVPSPVCGLALRRELGRSGLVNVRFQALARVAELVGAPTLAATRRPLTDAIRTEAVHAVLADAPAWLAPVARHPSTEERVAASFLDLARAGATARAALVQRGGRVADVVDLFDRFAERTTGFYDEDDLLRAAAEVLQSGASSPLAELGHVVVYLPRALSPAEEALVRALGAVGQVSVIIGLTGDADVDGPHARALASRLEPFLGAPVGDDDAAAARYASGMLRTPDPDDEVRAVARSLLERAASGTPFHRMAVLYRIQEPYARVVGEVLSTAGIPWSGPSQQRLAGSVVGRVLLGLLELADRDFARDAVAAWLVSGPIVDPVDSHLVDAARWDIVSREAGVVAGAAQWAERLTHHVAALDERLEQLRGNDEEPEWRSQRLESDRDSATRLAAFIDDLTSNVEAPADAGWAAFTAWVIDLVDRYLGAESKRASWPDDELDAGRRIVDALRDLSALDDIGTEVDVARFRHAVTVALDVPGHRVGTFGTGVFVGSTAQAYGTSFDVIYVVGAVEGSFPPRGGEDPLVPDADRRAAGNLELHAERRIEERREYLAMLASAHEVVLCFPRADPRAQRKRLPARWVIESAEHLHGEPLTAEALRELLPNSWLRVVASFEDGFAKAAEVASIVERDLRSLHAWSESGARIERHPLVAGELADGFRAQAGRSSRRVTDYDGFIGARDELAPGIAHPVSPTSLQDWATCPFRYLLGSVLRIREISRPEAIETISALDEGTLVHGVLEEFMREMPSRAPDEPWTERERARLSEIAKAHCAEAEASGLTGRHVQWLLARRRILRTIDRFPFVDTTIRRQHGAAPAPDGLEVVFGLDGAPPATLMVGERPVSFRGRIDRVDVSPDGTRVIVYDYKTGNLYNDIAEDPVDRGRKLQLPVYALAAAERVGAQEAEAYYWYVREPDAESALVGYPVDDLCRERFAEVIGAITEAIAEGEFPARPGNQSWDVTNRRESFESCRFCAFDRVCPVDRGQAYERKDGDPAYAALLSLVPPEQEALELT